MPQYYNGISVEGVISQYFVRYDKLSQLIPYAFKGSTATELNIYIDLYSIYHTLYSRSFITEIGDYTDFTSMIINMCAHYRSYFKYIGVHTKIFIISSFNIPAINSTIIPEYNSTMKDKLKNTVVGNMVNLNIELLNILCPYLPDIFFFKSDYESSCTIFELINRDINTPSLIITKDLYPFQISNLVDNVAVLVPSKHYPDDTSYIIAPRNSEGNTHRESYWISVILKTNKKSTSYDNMLSISPYNQILLHSINSYPSRDIKKCLRNINVSKRIIEQVTLGQDIQLSPADLFNMIDPNTFTEEEKIIIQNRYNTLNVMYQNIYYQSSVEPKTIQLLNLHDPDTINVINSKYFSKNPIDIFRL